MAAISNATALASIDAVVIDTETTGLDPSRAWIVEFAAVRLSGGAMADPARSFLFNPGLPIPPQATAIHGFDDGAVADKPAFAQRASEVVAALGDGILIGHSLGFDLAVLKREFARAGAAWRAPRTLDTQLLAETVAPRLPGYSLDNVAAWLGVAIERRHSAAGDAEATARVFLALVPLLRDAGIRTLAEAERACRARTATLEEQHRAGWTEVVTPSGFEMLPAPIDSDPYRHRVADVMSVPPRIVAPETTIAAALDRMMAERVSSLFMGRNAHGVAVHCAEAGIVTERDVLRAIASGGPSALTKQVAEIANRPLITIPADAFCYRAIARMNRHAVRHLGVTDAEGRLVGALSARDLLRLRAEAAIELGDEIEAAAHVSDLARAWARLPEAAAALIATDVAGRQIAAVVSSEVCALSARAAALAEMRMREGGHGDPPCPYAFAVLGSAGRGESLLAMDQDNALVFAEGAPDGPEDAWFARFGAHAADILHEAGVPYCKGGVMAKNPQWRGSVATWQDRIARWIGRSRPDDLLAVDIFFDMLAVHGDAGLADSTWRSAFDAAKGNATFAKLLADAAGAAEPGLTLFRRFRTDQGRIDLKKSGLFGIVGAARALAICHHVVERATPARLTGIKAAVAAGAADLDALAEAQATFLDLIVRQQVDDVRQGIAPTNRVLVRPLSGRDRERLRRALEAVEPLGDLVRDLLFRA